MAARREPWLVIDPKPLAGEREFGLSPVIRAYELGHSRRDVLYRLDRMTGELGLDRERARLWAFGQAIAWGFEAGKVIPRHVETARWLLEAG
jgi:streptomycin 6-kinase